MTITIHRGTDQIGGCVTEYKCDDWRLFVDYGEQLPGAQRSEPLQIEGLTYGDISKSALLITHYHGDHIGCITELPENLKIYMSTVGRDIQRIVSEHIAPKVEMYKAMVERLDKMDTFSPGEAFKYGIFKIMPIIADHSAFDASSFKIEAGGVKVFHTGDFRLNGFRSGNYDKVLNKYIGKVDYVVCEGTNAAYPDVTNTKESELQQQFYQEFCEHKGNVVYLSSSNIDRLFSIYHAAKRAGRPFLVDHYQKRVMDAIVEKDHIWGKSSLYQYGRFKPYDNVDHFENNPKLKNLLEDKGYVLIARATDRFDSLIKRLPGEKQKYLSMWRGYLKEGHEAYNEKLAKALEDGYLYRHTSGHCDMKSLHEFFALLSPKAIIPIHTNNPDGFTKYFNDEWPIIRLHDGELRTLSQNVSQL